MNWISRFLAMLVLLFAVPAIAVVTSPTVTQTDTANGSTTAFAYNFLIPYQSDGITPAVSVVVVNSATGVTTSLPSAQYAITGVGTATGGAITYPLSGSPLPNGSTVTITRTYSYTQNTAISNYGFYPHTTEQVADSLEYQIQQLNQLWATGSIVGPVTSWNGRTGSVVPVAGDITTALGYTPANMANAIFATDKGASASTQSTTLLQTASPGATTLTLNSGIDFKNGQGIRVNHAGAAFTDNSPTGLGAATQGTAGSTHRWYNVVSLDCAGGVGAKVTDYDLTTSNATNSVANYNHITWTFATGTAPCGYAIYRAADNSGSPGTYSLIGITPKNSFDDVGQALVYTPDWLPTTPQTSSLADFLVTSVVSGGGTSTLAINNATTTTVANGTGVFHDDTAVIQAAINGLTSGGTLYLPAAMYNISSPIVLPNTTAITLAGQGRGFSPQDGQGTSGGTILNMVAATSQTSGVINSGASYILGDRITSLTVEGNGLAQYDFYFPYIDSSQFDNLYLLNASYENWRLGLQCSGGGCVTTAEENHTFNVRMDNPMQAVASNLPYYNFRDVWSTDNEFVGLIGVNAAISNFLEDTNTADNNYFYPHGYNYLESSAVPHQPPTYNFVVSGFGDKFTSLQADGAATADLDIQGFGSMFTNSFYQFDGVTAAECVRIESGFYSNTLSAQTFYQCSNVNSVVDVAPSPGGNTVQGVNGTSNVVVNRTVEADAQYQENTWASATPITIPSNISYLLLHSIGTMTAQTITMPALPAPGMKVTILADQAITSLTINANSGQSINSPPTTMLANTAFTFFYEANSATWFRYSVSPNTAVGVSCTYGASPTATFVVTNGVVTHC